jgi:anti-sigma-K factor RskA
VNESRILSDGSDLDWLAFQYVAGELSAIECEAFELRLADDQAAREAVARAVDLSGALASARSVITQPVSQFPGVSLRWRRLAAAACVAALVILGVSLRLLQKPATDDEVRQTGNANAQTTTEWVALWPSEADSDSDDVELSFNETEQSPMTDAPTDDLAVPSWMVAALEHDHDDPVEEE